MRVLHCVASLSESDGGPARSVPALAQAEAEQGADVTVWSEKPATIPTDAYPAVRFLSGSLHDGTVPTQPPDIIHDHGVWLPSNHRLARFARHNRIARIVSPRGMLEPWCLRHRQFKKLTAWMLYQRRDLRSSTALHATSEAEALQMRTLGLAQPIVILPNGVRIPDMAAIANKPASGEKEVLFLSRIHPKKGLINLIHAWRNACQPGWTLRIVGPDENGHRDEVQRAVDQQNLSNCVQICEPVSDRDKWELLRRADLTVLPSFSENFGIVVAESLAVGTPVIATTPTPWGALKERQCGWYVPPTIERVGKALGEAISMPGPQLAQMGARGTEWIRSDFTWQSIGKQMLDGYSEITGGSRQQRAAA